MPSQKIGNYYKLVQRLQCNTVYIILILYYIILIFYYFLSLALRPQLFQYAVLGFALSEATGLFALMIAFLILYS